MDGRTRYNKITELLKPIVGQTLELHKLKNRVRIEIGTSEVVVEECLRLMMDLGLINEVSNLKFKVIRSEAEI